MGCIGIAANSNGIFPQNGLLLQEEEDQNHNQHDKEGQGNIAKLDPVEDRHHLDRIVIDGNGLTKG